MNEPKSNAGRVEELSAEFGEAVTRCRPRLAGLLRSRRGEISEEDVDEILQETLARAIQLRERFESRGDDDALFRWLSSIALNVSREHGRGRRGQRLSAQPELAGSSITRSRAQRREERFDRLQDAIDTLPEEYRELVMLVRIDGLPVKDVAERLGKTPNAISRMLLRATKKLRESFGDTASLALPPRRLEAQSPNREAEGGDDGT